MRLGTVALLVLSSLVNAALCAGALLFALFATSPDMSDVTMRIGYYVLHMVAVAGAAGVVLPWMFALRQQNKAALVFSLLPAFLACLSVVAFLTLDSWLSRTFSGQEQNPAVATPDSDICTVSRRGGKCQHRTNGSGVLVAPFMSNSNLVTGRV